MIEDASGCKWKVTELPSIDVVTVEGLWMTRQKGTAMAAEKKTLKFQMMMSPGEAEALDEWMFANRIRSRAEAIRRLCQVALLADSKEKEILPLRQQLMKGANALMATVVEDMDADRLETAARYMNPTIDVVESTAFLQMQVGIIFEYLRHLKLGETYSDAEATAKDHLKVIEEAIADMKAGQKVKLGVNDEGNVIRKPNAQD